MVDVLNENGEVIGQKQRREINKAKDIHHTIFVLLITPDKHLLLGQIPAREDLPNLYANLYGSTIATIRRSDENSAEAAVRGVARELFIDDPDLELIGEGMEQFDGIKQSVSVFVLRSEAPDEFSLIDVKELKPMKRRGIEAWIRDKPGKLAPSFRMIWEKYGKKLPL